MSSSTSSVILATALQNFAPYAALKASTTA
jgi:hypothetical protein